MWKSTKRVDRENYYYFSSSRDFSSGFGTLCLCLFSVFPPALPYPFCHHHQHQSFVMIQAASPKSKKRKKTIFLIIFLCSLFSLFRPLPKRETWRGERLTFIKIIYPTHDGVSSLTSTRYMENGEKNVCKYLQNAIFSRPKPSTLPLPPLGTSSHL